VIDRIRGDNCVRDFAEEHIPDLLQGPRYSIDVVFERIVLLGNIHDECWDKITLPDLKVDPMWEMFILDFFAGVHQSGFLFGHQCLFRGELVKNYVSVVEGCTLLVKHFFPLMGEAWAMACSTPVISSQSEIPPSSCV
jgi:hypothetical protein